MEEFALCLEKILELRDQLRQKQKVEDEYLNLVLKNHQISQNKKQIESTFLIKPQSAAISEDEKGPTTATRSTY